MFIVKVPQFITATFQAVLKTCLLRGFQQVANTANRIRWIPLLLISAVAGWHHAALATPVELVFEDHRLPGSKLYLAIYDAGSSQHWEDAPLRQVALTTDQSDPWVTRLDLPPGKYAARAFLDTDGDGELKTGAAGRPVEPFAISVGDNRKKPSVRFRQSIFTVGDAPLQVKIPLLYPRGSDTHQAP